MRILLLWHLLFALLIAAPYTLSPEEEQWIQEHPSINYIGDPDWLPFEGFEGNRYVGIVADYLKVIEKRSSLHFNIIQTDSWDDSLQRMKAGEAIMISQSKDSNRETGYNKTLSYLKNPIVIVMASNNKYVESLYDIRDKRIAVVASQAYYNKLIATYPTIKFIEVSDLKEGLESVSSGRSDAFVHTLAQTSYTIAKMQVNNLRIVGRTQFNTRLVFGVSKKEPMLVNILNKILQSIEPNVSQEILSKWIYQKYVQEANYTPYIIGLAGLILILILALIYSSRLKHEVLAKEESQAKLRELNTNLESRISKEVASRQEQEVMLEQQARSAAMGEMMDAVAHQWKQPLNALTMYGDLLNADFKDGLVTQKYLDEMLEGVGAQIEHMTTTLSEFRTFFRPNKEVEEINLLKSIDSVLLLLKDELTKNSIEVDVILDAKLTIKIIENEFKHVILNIINNAKDAFNENNIASRRIKISALASHDFVEITLCDNAGGIAKQVINSIFKPNVTTKPKGKGTGIGLYMSARIIEKNHGSIYAYNNEDGACFNIELNRNI